MTTVLFALTWWGLALSALVCGLSNGFAINTAHELGHKYGDKVSLNFAKLALVVPFYGHFNVEHNRGHHRQRVATPEDPASSRLGESIYRFVLREIANLAQGFRIGTGSIKKRKKSFGL